MLQQKATTYVEENLITQGRSDAIMAVIMAERGDSAIANDQAIGLDDAGGSGGKMLTLAQLQELLAKRERQMQEGGTPEQPTDQCASGRGFASWPAAGGCGGESTTTFATPLLIRKGRTCA